MSARRSSPALPHRLRHRIGRHLGIDTRALAALRICLGLVLVADLLLRARNLRQFYTDAGALPVSALAERTPILAEVSIHAQSGAAGFQLLLFAVAIAVALALAVGYETRLATAGSLLLLLSLHARNPALLSGGDGLLQHLLFWSLFLPLGERWSLDARRRDRPPRDRIVSVASAALLLQVLIVYGVNAVVKLRSDRWMAGDAVEVVFGLDQYTVLLGPVLAELPTFLELANWTWIALLVASPLLVLATRRVRTALVGAFAGMHAGMALTMDLGIFPVVSIVALLPFLPAGIWAWIVHAHSLQWLRSTGAGLLVTLDGFLPRRPRGQRFGLPGRWRRISGQTIAGISLALLLSFNAMALGLVPVPQPVDENVDREHLDSRWTLFAPHPPETDRWYVAPADRVDGDPVDAYREGRLRWGRPSDVAATYSSARARKFMATLRHDDALQRSFTRYLCNRWSRNHDSGLATVELYAVETPARGGGAESPERVELARVRCDRPGSP